MADTAVKRRLVAASEADAAATVLARAFANDPLWCYLLPEANRRVLALRQSFRATLPLFVEQQVVWGIGAPLVGVAIWRPPHPPSNPWTALLNPNTLTLLFSPWLSLYAKAIPIFGQFERMHQHYAQQSHYYLSTIGIVPQAQGRGEASYLLRPVLSQADAEGRAAYTETMTPANVPLYRYYGFQVQEHYRVPNSELSIWSLLRPASSASRAS
jgi:GNAT superfamily N-acetyltransferase